MNALVAAWIWACETRLILAPAAAGTWLLCRFVYRAAWRWAATHNAPAWNWRDELDPEHSAAEEAALDQAALDLDTCRQIAAAGTARQRNTRKEGTQ